MTIGTPPRATSSREVALHVVRDVFGPSLRAAQGAFDYRSSKAQLSDRDRAFAAELAYGTIKMRRAIDWYLAPYAGDRLATLPQAIAEILRLGAYQLVWMSGVTNRAAVHESVSLARIYGHRGTAGLVNAVLRRLSDSPPPPPPRDRFAGDAEYLATLHSFPTWIVSRLVDRFPGADHAAMLTGMNRAPQLCVRVNAARASVEEAQTALAALALSAERSPLVSEALVLDGGGTAAKLEASGAGRWDVQSESACIPVDVLDPQPGEAVLELCSGRGHKTVQIGARMRGAGTITAIDSDGRKNTTAQAALERAGITNARFIEGDATNLPADLPAADAVLLDAPCSASGILGRHPEARWRKSPEDAQRLAHLQRDLLASAAAHVRPGGRMVYSVCSFEACENEAVIDDFLAAHSDFARGPLAARYGGVSRGGDIAVAPGLDRRDGFYVAALRRAHA